ncbi:MAG: amidohydrolase family protein [bacterium]|nr:amidohydrolase family protein [bacterium]
MTAHTFIKNARVLTMDDEGGEHPRANILIRGSEIESIGPDVAPDGRELAREIDATGMLVMPGITNAHFHSTLNMLKGVRAIPLSVLILSAYEMVAARAGETMDPGLVRHVISVTTSLGAIEMLKCGVTSVHDDAHHFLNPLSAAVPANVQAYADSGLRATIALAQTNVVEYDKYPFLKDSLPPDIRKEMEQTADTTSDDEILDNYRSYIDQWHDTADGRIHAAVSISSPERVTTELLCAAYALSQERGVVFEAHCQEAKYQRILAEQRHKKSWIAYMDELGVLSSRVHLNHVVWTDARDIEILARTGTTVSHNVHCNLFIGSGLMPLRQMREAGVPVGIGVDEMDASGTINPWEVAKMAMFAQHLSDPDWERWLGAGDMLWCLTRGGALGMSRADEVGRLAPGCQADLIMIDLNTLAFAPLNDLPTQLVMGDQGRSVVMTMVAGRVVMENGVVTTVDEEAVKRAVRELAEVLPQGADTSRLYPYARRMQLRAEETDVGFDRSLHAHYNLN